MCSFFCMYQSESILQIVRWVGRFLWTRKRSLTAPSCFELSTNHEWWVSAIHMHTMYVLYIVSFPCINKNGKRLSNYYCQIDSEKVKS